MSYKIGQIRKVSNNIPEYYLQGLELAKVNPENYIITKGYDNRDFENYTVQLKDGDFSPTNTYYLRFSIKRINHEDERFSDSHYSSITVTGSNDPREMNIQLTLFKHNGRGENRGIYELGSTQVIQANVRVQPYIKGLNTEWTSFEVIFTPNDNYKYLGFILARTNYDYLEIPPRSISEEENIDLGDKGDLCIIKNILPKKPASKIGIQSRPGTLICVNKEAIRIGRSGIYQVNNGVAVSFVGIVAPNGSDTSNIDNFILDYAWDE